MTRKQDHLQEEVAYLSLRAPADLAERFRRIAEAEDRTVSQELRRLMSKRVAEKEKETA